MNSTVATIATALSMLGVVVLAQDRGPQPGQATQARVFIDNRGEAQAVPVAVMPGAHMAITGPVAIDPSTVVNAHAVRQSWEYEALTVPAGSNAAALTAAGAQGWEAVGVISPAPDLVVLMKRPR